MLLNKQDAELFYSLYFKVLKSYFNSLQNSSTQRRDFNSLPPDEILSVRDKLFDNVAYLNTYCSENKEGLSDEELEIIKQWKFFVKKTFIAYKNLKKYTVFVDTQESLSYGVIGLMTEISDILENKFPVMVDALLLSYKNVIVFDGMLAPYEMKISGALGKILINSYRDSKNDLGIITQLPPVSKDKKKSGEEKLEYFLLKNKDSNAYNEEILKLITQNLHLLKQYYDGFIRPNKEIYSAMFRTLGLKKGWFAVLDGIIITSGQTENEVLDKLMEFLPPDKIENAVIFQI